MLPLWLLDFPLWGMKLVGGVGISWLLFKVEIWLAGMLWFIPGKVGTWFKLCDWRVVTNGFCSPLYSCGSVVVCGNWELFVWPGWTTESPCSPKICWSCWILSVIVCELVVLMMLLLLLMLLLMLMFVVSIGSLVFASSCGPGARGESSKPEGLIKTKLV